MSSNSGTKVVTAATNVAKNASQVASKLASNAANVVTSAAKNAGQVVTNAAAAAATTATATAAAVPSSSTNWFLWIAIAIAVILLTVFLSVSGVFASIKNKINNRPSPANNRRIVDQRTQDQAVLADMLAEQHSGIIESANGASSATPNPAVAGLADVPDPEEALVNFHVLGARNAGYLGPHENGMFDEAQATRLAIRKGCRLFVFEIDYLRRDPTVPVLVNRDAGGNLLSNNTGRIANVCKALATYTKAQTMAAQDPIIILLSVRRLPKPKPDAGSTDPDNLRARLQFMAAIAGEMRPIFPYMLKGDYARQAKQGDLFREPITNFENKFIVLTNLDTTDFRQPELPVSVSTYQDLDMMVNARVYASQDKGGPAGYSIPTSSDIHRSAVANSYNYYLTIPADKVEAESTAAKMLWSVALSPAGALPPTAAELKTVMDSIGVQGIAVDIFAEKDQLTPLFEKSRFARFSYVAKRPALRYKQAAVVQIAPANKAADANSGNLTVPAL